MENAGLTGSPPCPRSSAFQSSAGTSTNDHAPSNSVGYVANACRSAVASFTHSVLSYFWLHRNWTAFGVEPFAGKRTVTSFRVWVCAAHAAKRTAIRTLFFTVVTPQVPPNLAAAPYYLNVGKVRTG